MVRRLRDYDPIEAAGLRILTKLLRGKLSASAKEGFLIVGPRFVDEFGNHRIGELRHVFRTDTHEGRRALHLSLERMNNVVGGLNGYEKSFPVTVIPPRPAFPLFKIVGIETFVTEVYRVFDSAAVTSAGEKVIDHVIRTGRLPQLPRQRKPVRRSKPRFHWCSYRRWATPKETAMALQILPVWNSDCGLRATISAAAIRNMAYVAFNGDRRDPDNEHLRFVGYFYEPVAQDHPALPGGGLQIGVEGAPTVIRLEKWSRRGWQVIWTRRT